MLLSGVVVRPPGSDGYWPPVGTRVSWVATQPVNDLMEQDLKYPQFSNLGVIGNTDHLKKHGGHTPWRPGAVRGKVYAKDTACPPGFREWLIKKCKSDYDTMWIRFWNCDNKQYDAAGNYLGYSGDHHFHCEVQNGYENTRVTLFDDFIKETQGDVMDARQEAILVGIQKMLLEGISPTGTETTSGGVDRIYLYKKMDEMEARLRTQLTGISTTVGQAVRDAVAGMDIDLTEAQLDELVDGVVAGVNRPQSGTWTTNPVPEV